MIPVSPTRKQAQSGEGTCQKPSGQSAFGLCWSPLYSAASAPLRPRGQAAGGEAGRGTVQGALGLGQKQVQRKASLAAGRGLVTWRATDRIRPAPPPVLSVPSPPWRSTRIRRSPRPRALRRPQAPWFQHLGQRQHGGSAGSGRAPWPFPLRPDERGSGKGTWVRTSPGVLGDPSFICSFIHSTPSPWSRP